MNLKEKDIIAALLKWYGRHKRALPWREDVSPYRVWLSEIMLQQTTVPAVIKYFLDFTARWPRVEDLAAASLDEVMHAWAGLGYYSRARNLHACAVKVRAMGGVFPSDIKELEGLPGIGPYTAGAVRAIAFNERANVVDGNVERVISRLYALQTPLPASKPTIKAYANDIYMSDANTQPAALPQAFMDLGAGICTPTKPKCGLCPIADMCQGRAQGIADALPARMPKKARPVRYGYVYWVENAKGDVLVHRRPAKGLLGGMVGLPTSDWVEGAHPAPLAGFEVLDENFGEVRHVFTHFELRLRIVRAGVRDMPDGGYYTQASKAGFPSLFNKVHKFIHKKV